MRAQRACEVHRCRITGPREGEDSAPLPDGELHQQVRRRTKSVQPQRYVFAGHPIGAPADQAGAQHWRDLLGIGGEPVEGDAGRGFRDDMRREAAIARAAGEARRVA